MVLFVCLFGFIVCLFVCLVGWLVGCLFVAFAYAAVNIGYNPWILVHDISFKVPDAKILSDSLLLSCCSSSSAHRQ